MAEIRAKKVIFKNRDGEYLIPMTEDKTGLVLFDTILKDHVLTYEESKGLALQGTYVYKEAVAGSRYGYADFYNKCLEEYNEATGTETINGVTVNVNSNGHKFYDIADKDAVDSFFNTMGTAWFYGIDTENERIFLPRNNYLTSYITDGSKKVDVYGTGKALGMTNGSAKVGTSVYNSWEMAYQVAAFNKDVGTRPNTSASNPSNSNYTVFGVVADSATSGLTGSVDLQNINNGLYVYICVGNTEVTSAVTDVVEVTTTENDTIPLFTGMYFDFTPNNPSWLKAGEQKHSGNVYTSCYNELVNEFTSPKYGLKVINVADMIAGIDYSEYWKVNQDDMTFTTPTTISNKALSGAVVGNGMTLGLTNGSDTFSVTNIATYGFVASNNFGSQVGTAYTGTTTGDTSIGITTDPTKSGIIAEESTAQLYFKVANAVQNLELMDVAKIEATKANKTDVDGQWIPTSTSEVMDGTALLVNVSLQANTPVICDLTPYLPNDGYNYEILLNATGETGNVSGNGARVYVKSGTSNYFNLSFDTTTTRTSSIMAWGGSVMIPIFASEKSITLTQVHNSTCKLGRLSLAGYRRIGTNL